MGMTGDVQVIPTSQWSGPYAAALTPKVLPRLVIAEVERRFMVPK